MEIFTSDFVESDSDFSGDALQVASTRFGDFSISASEARCKGASFQ
jgi:hypothetical protein